MRLLSTSIVFLSLSGCGTGPPPPNTAARVRHWIEALRQADPKWHKEAAFKLGNLGLTNPAAIVPALTAALKDDDAAVRCQVILALLKCGPEAKQATGRLAEVEKMDVDARVRAYAAKALDKLRTLPGPATGQ